uniref:2-dehydro-3-deoxygalactonokinase n=1 Tax=uncultured Halomonas sp. TaxID=173971 RepID=UPI0026358E87|nr:2-dehydro-3-deoxygalactonokinase [uncultured Halomonas sp.]
MNGAPAWIAVDWGSSNLRAWALDEDDHVIAQTGSPRGMLGLAPEAFEGALLEVIADWLPPSGEAPLPVLVCGMAGSRQGWVEAAYLRLDDVPGDLLDRLASRLAPVTTQDSRLRVRIVPGLCQHQDSLGDDAFDVMRGEETQLAGLIAKRATFSGAVCLPGTHAKWARLEDGNIAGFTTFMSGELFKLLRHDSVLKHSLRGDDPSDAAQRDSFLAGLDAALAAPGQLSAELFGLRARDLLDTRLPQDNTRGARLGARLSGLVLGLELAGATAGLPAGSQVVLIGEEALCRRYQTALEHLGFAVSLEANAEMVLAGLGHIRHLSATP